jgi:hypothetical protein
VEPYRVLPSPRPNSLKILFGPYRGAVVNWDEVATCALDRARREAVMDRDPARRRILDECLANAPAGWSARRLDAPARLVIPVPTPNGGAWWLEADEVMRLPRGRASTTVKVHRGTVLVTQEGDPDDHVLEAEDALVLRSRGRAVAWALTAATISLRDVASTERSERGGYDLEKSAA